MLLVDSARDLLNRAEPEGALPLLKEAVALAPGLAEAHFQLAIALNRSQPHTSRRRGEPVRPGQGDEIEAELLRVIELDPSHAQAYMELGLRRASRGEIPSAIDALRRAVSIAPGRVAAQRALADRAMQREDWRTAVSALEAVLAWEPEDVPAALALASVLLLQHDCAGAATLFQRAAGLDREQASSQRELVAGLKGCDVQPRSKNFTPAPPAPSPR
jgi:tetratricopeptide (TPR) repeat protein